MERASRFVTCLPLFGGANVTTRVLRQLHAIRMIVMCDYLNIAFFFLSSVMTAVPCTVSSQYRICFFAASSNSFRELGGCQLPLFYDVHTETGIKHAAAAVNRC